jgi:adenylate cyclase
MKKADRRAQIRIHLLGPPTIERNGEKAKVETRKALALLAYLAVERRSHGRATLVASLWPEADEAHGRAVLRRTLHALSAVFPSGVLRADRDQIALSDDPRIWIDIDELRKAHLRCVESGKRCRDCPRPLRAAADLYQDDFLSGFSLKDSVAFDDWQFFQAETFRRTHTALLEKLVDCLVNIADYETGVQYASRWLELDSLDETPHIALMKLHAMAGRRSTALRQYESCRCIVRKEIGEEPSERVKRLARDIQSGSFPGPAVERDEDGEAPAGRVVPAGLDRHPATLLALRLTEPAAQEAGTRFLSSLYGLVLRHGGRIERHIGQMILISFGSGSTRESAPELAVRAAIEFRAAARRHGVTVAVGVNHGVIAVPGGADTEAAGELLTEPAMSEARRLAANAKGDEILVSESTFRNTRRAARYSHVREPGRKATCHRLGALLDEPRKTRGIEGLGGRLVGRDEELARLRQALDEVLRGKSRLVTVIGEAGVGKSRLIAEGRAAARVEGEEGPLWLEGRCLDIGVAVGYWPFIDILRQVFAWRPEDADRRHIERIGQTINDLESQGYLDPGRSASTTRHLFLLLSAKDSGAGGDDAGTTDPDTTRAGIFEAVRDLVVALARRRPLVLVFEDLHWADTLTLDLISFLMDSLLPSASGEPPALGLLCVYRPQQEHRCRHISTVAFGKCPDRYTEIVVHDLTPEKSAELVEALLETRDLPESLTRAILDRSQGNPFFLEEIVRSLIDTGVLYRARGRWRARASRVAGGVPESVESMIRGTTDRLPAEARRIMRAASVLGRVFDAVVLNGMVQDGERIETHLRLLEENDLVYEERTVPRREFSFRHVLTRDAVYAGMPESQRRELHELAARTILELFGERPEPYLERLAYHYESAHLEKDAVRYLHQAGRKAIRSSDNQAAIGLLERALALVRGWPSGPQRDAAELEILVALGVPVTATTGYGSPETRKVYQRAVDLCASGDPPATVFAATYGLWRYQTLRGNLARSLDLAGRLADSCRDLSDDTMHLEAQRALACSLTHAGRLKEADGVLEAAIAAYDPARHRTNAFIYGHDPAATFYCYRALILWLFGLPDGAAALIDRLWELLRDSSHRLSLTYACSIGAQVFQLRGDVERVLSMSSRGVALATEGHLLMFGAFAEVMQGWALMMRGDAALGVKRMREGLKQFEASSGGAFGPYLRSLLADAMWRSGDAAGAAGLLQETSREIESGDHERNFESEIYRLQGEIHMEAGSLAQAEPFLRKAALTAEAAGALSLRLRAAFGLAHLHALRGEPLIGRRLVEDAVAMLHEGHDTADLRDAARLLQELG